MKQLRMLFMYMCLLFCMACNKDEEIFLVTDRADAYISDLQLYTADNRNVVVGLDIDDESGVITAEVKNGVNMAHLKPRCSLAPEATVTPKMGVWTDFSSPVEYFVISGNREVTKKYVINIVEQE